MTHPTKWWTGIPVRSYFPEPSFYDRAKTYLIGVLLATVIILLILIGTAGAQIVTPTYTDTQIVNAIYKAEGGAKATYAYGIRSVKYNTVDEARRICFNTVRNNRKRFAKQSKYTDFIDFLASRYCPVGCVNDRGTNKYWVKNVRYFLKEA